MELKIKISIVIPVYRDLSGLQKTISSIEKQDLSHAEIIVVNDGADSDIERYCIDKGLVTKTISPNLGSYNARNEGIKMAKSNCLAFTDADLEVGKDWLNIGLKYLQTYDYVAGSVQINRSMVYDMATFHDSLTAFPVESYFIYHHFGVTANLFMKKSVIEKVGFFDAELRSGGDLEFGDRVHRAGISQFYAHQCKVVHPPRGHQEKLTKLKRVKNGQKVLLEKYPERFEFLKKKGGPIEFIKQILPPSIMSASRVYPKDAMFSFWQFYRYLYRWKLINIS